MMNDENSGWVYHIGDAIFGDILLVNASNLKTAFNIYASTVSIDTGTDSPDSSSSKDIQKYDCIIVNEVDGALFDKHKLNYYYSKLKEDSVFAVVSNNNTSLNDIKKISYVWMLFKRIFIGSNKIKDKYKSTVLLNANYNRFYMRSEHGIINEVFYDKGYSPLKNPFLISQKIRKYLFSKLTYPIFSSTTLDVFNKNNSNTDTVIRNIINKVADETELYFSTINRCLVIPYKVLVSVSTRDNERYIFLLLRGSDKNIRANKELEMLKYLNETYPDFSASISNPIANGIYKNVEYIVYREIPGIIIDSTFNKFNIAEKSAFLKLIELGKTTIHKSEVDDSLFKELTYKWFMKLKECFIEDDKFICFIDDLYIALREQLIGKCYNLVHFHGDYKIENIIFTPSKYSVNGIIDWDLSMINNFPGLDLLYFILYNRRIKNSTSFVDECEQLFIKNGYTDLEKIMIFEYQTEFNISDDALLITNILFIIHHFSCRERCRVSEEWLIQILTLMLSKYNNLLKSN